jgi:aryl-alcohol dehydrogenase-like predicted oxidoreductase
LRRWKEEGRVRYIGITHYVSSAFDSLERIMLAEPLDFVQLPYSARMREAERRLLPLAADRGIAVIVNRPLEEGALLRLLSGRPLPPVAAEVGAESWSELLLRFVVSHPAVTCAIPATSRLAHLTANMRAGSEPLLTETQRQAVIDAVA